MPSCLNCGNFFPNWQKVDGKLKSLRSRKYCLDCSPFGKGNNKRIHTQRERESGIPCICLSCGRAYKYVRGTGHTLKRCNSCLSNGKRADKKLKALAYKGGRCMLCGYDRCTNALSFHHLDNGKTKEFGISGRHGMRWEVLQQELDKCVLLCMNCHAEVHAGLVALDSSLLFRTDSVMVSSPGS